MTKCYRVTAVGLMCVFLTAPIMAGEIAEVEMIRGEVRPLTDYAPLDCCSQTVYDNQGSNFALVGPHWNLLDDGMFPAGTAPVTVSCLRPGWYQSDTAQTYIFIDFWDTLDPDGPVCNLTYLGGVGLNLGVVDAGAWYVDVVLPSPVYFPDDSWYVQMSYYEASDPWTPSTVATVIFSESGPTVGSNDSLVFWLDADNSGSFECPDEESSFGADNKAQFFLRLGADLGPSATEETTWGAIKALYR